mmetsp:Transcript_44336/g.89009  ORF Transcript_44336/g.89009 Transcript_44336/m.89009 type:complete len:242 (-) Transcript_44336:539-1264(-)
MGSPEAECLHLALALDFDRPLPPLHTHLGPKACQRARTAGLHEQGVGGGADVHEEGVCGARVGEGCHAAGGVDGVAENRGPGALESDDARRERTRRHSDLKSRRLPVRAKDRLDGFGHSDGEGEAGLDVSVWFCAVHEQKAVEGLHFVHGTDVCDAGVQALEDCLHPLDRRPRPVPQHQLLVSDRVGEHSGALLDSVQHQLVALQEACRERGRRDRSQQLVLQLRKRRCLDQQTPHSMLYA